MRISDWSSDVCSSDLQWRLAGCPVDPTQITLPTLCVIPAQDRIVPPASATALADAIPGAERLTPAAGHIGMVVGARAEKRSEEHTSELQSLMRISYAVFCLKKKTKANTH